MIREGKGYYDVVDLHLYEEKETFMEGKITWMRSLLDKYDITVPIWCIEGGGPHKLKLGQQSVHGDSAFGYYTDQENAEFVVKMHAMGAANGIERFHWGLRENAETAYWNGPWCNMALVKLEGQKKPSFYTFQLLRENFMDFIEVKDLSFDRIKLYEFKFNNQKKYIAWLRDAFDPETVDLGHLLVGTGSDLKMEYFVTELNPNGSPIFRESITVPTVAVPLSNTPVMLSSLATGVGHGSINPPANFRLDQNFPNPFNPATTIRFFLPQSSHVTLKVFDVLGREVAVLIDNELYAPGQHCYKWQALSLPNGLYFYQIMMSQFSQTRKAMLLK